MYDYYDMDNYPIGTNAIVAVISYTGYDMEDAMVSAVICDSNLFHCCLWAHWRDVCVLKDTIANAFVL